MHVVIDHISNGGNAIACVRLSIRLFVSTLSLESTDLELCIRIGHDHSSQEIEGQGHGSG